MFARSPTLFRIRRVAPGLCLELGRCARRSFFWGPRMAMMKTREPRIECGQGYKSGPQKMITFDRTPSHLVHGRSWCFRSSNPSGHGMMAMPRFCPYFLLRVAWSRTILVKTKSDGLIPGPISWLRVRSPSCLSFTARCILSGTLGGQFRNY